MVERIISSTFGGKMRFILPVFICICIYAFSAMDGSISSEQSRFFVGILQNIGIFQAISFKTTEFIVRKFAHGFEYAFLGGSSFFALKKVAPKKSQYIAFVFSVFFAIFDEIHQLFVSGRAGKIQDILIDSVGIMIGISMVKIFSRE